jgi:hypothetical protein
MALAGKRSKRRKVDFSSGLAKNIVPLWRRKLSAASTPEIERGVNARKRRVAALPCDGKSLTEISATLSTG